MIDSVNLKSFSSVAIAILILVAAAGRAEAQGLDRIRDRNGVTTGRITKMSALAITLTKSGVDSKKPVEEILNITFAGEPEDLTPARRAANSGRFQSALDRLDKIDRSAIKRPEIQQEINFLTTYCNVQLALSGQGALDQARTQVAGFLSKNSKSYHVPEAIELLGDVLLASDDFDGARAQYDKLGKAPAPYFKARSAMLIGRSLQAEGKHQEAVVSFDTALQAAEGNAVAQSQVLEASLQRAVSQSALGNVDQSTKTVTQIIAQAIDRDETEDTQLLAQAYNALGDCYLQAKATKAARQAFLHVDLLFSSSPNEHAKALYELSQLWEELGQSARARDARERLKSEYPGSRWAKR